jgi:hypothetical protein
MCRYGFKSYKSHWACFRCRKAFKQPTIEDYFAVRGQGAAYGTLSRLWSFREGLAAAEARLGVTLEELRGIYHIAVRACPECHEPMADLGLDFKAPRQSDTKAWRAIAGMYRVGHVWHTCGCDGPGYIPQSTGALRAYLLERRATFEDQAAVAVKQEESTAEARVEAAMHWASQIRGIDRELAALG